MSCREYIQMISDEIDGEIEESRALFLMRHLVSCDDCRGEYRGNLGLKDLVLEDSSRYHVDVPPSFSSRIIEVIQSDAASGEAAYIPEASGLEMQPAGLLSWIRGLRLFPRPALLLPLAASAVLLFSITLLDDSSTDNSQSRQALLDAKMIKPKQIVKVDYPANSADEADDINYYVNRHAEVSVYRNHIRRPVAGGMGDGLIRAAYTADGRN